jgi:hypothetical protein
VSRPVVVWINHDAQSISHHGPRAQREWRDADGVSVGRTLLSAARDLGVDFDSAQARKIKVKDGN